MPKVKNTNLHKAKAEKNDEFYTQLNDVANELSHYKEHFKGKVIFCNCDDPTWSAFWKYFHLNFEVLGLKKLISTHYDREKPTYKMIYKGGNDNDVEAGEKIPLEGNGDFRNAECVELLKEADVVVTNPPFSCYREYVAQLMEYGKDFIIWANNNSITYKEIFPLLKDNKMWLGYTGNKTLVFQIPDTYAKWDEKETAKMNDGHHYAKVPAISTFTNLDIKKRHEKLYLYKKYSPEEFPRYDNYNAINVNKVADIPEDYCESWEVTDEEFAKLPFGEWDIVRDAKHPEGVSHFVIPAQGTELRKLLHEHSEGYREEIEKALGDCLYDPGIMGVPVTFLDHHDADQFSIENPADYKKDLTGREGNESIAETDRQSGGLPGAVKRERVAGARSGRMACAEETDVRSDLCQEDTVTESSECRLHTLTSLTQENSLFTEQPNQKAKDSLTDYGIANPKQHNRLSAENADTREFLSERYCNGVMGVPITYLDSYNPEEFEIVSFRKGDDGKDLVFTRERERESSTVLSNPCQTSIKWPPQMFVGGKKMFFRILVRANLK